MDISHFRSNGPRTRQKRPFLDESTGHRVSKQDPEEADPENDILEPIKMVLFHMILLFREENILGFFGLKGGLDPLLKIAGQSGLFDDPRYFSKKTLREVCNKRQERIKERGEEHEQPQKTLWAKLSETSYIVPCYFRTASWKGKDI